jgi:DNA-binding Lrp family transcriptional regulator
MSSQNKWTTLQNILALEEDKLNEEPITSEPIGVLSNSGPLLNDGPLLDGGPLREHHVGRYDSGPPFNSGPLQDSSPAGDSGPTFSSGPLSLSTPEERSALDLRASLPVISGHTEVPHVYADHLCRILTPPEQSVYFQLFRLSWGWKKETCFISNPRLGERSNLGESTVRKVIKSLVAKNLIERVGAKFGSDGEQGVTYRVLPLSGPPRDSGPAGKSGPLSRGPIKEKDLKESNKKVLASPDYRKCPDCQGSGFWYPDGVEKGVAKCKHVRMGK